MWLRPASYGLVPAVVVALGLAATPASAAAQVTLSPASGPPGTEFVVTGTGFGALPVEIRWGGLSGPVLATAIGPDFSVIAVVPDSPANSHPVMAVVTNGASVFTSSASFQVTGAGVAPPEGTSTSTSTTTPAAAAVSPGTGRGGASGGVDGGVGPGPAGPVATTTPSTATGAGAGSTATSTPTTLAATVSTIPAVTPAPVVSTPAPAEGQIASTAPMSPDDGLTAAALVPARTNQSAGAVSNPALLFLGLALVFGGGVFLAVRNRYRA